MYEIGVEISEIARIFKITEGDVLKMCKGATSALAFRLKELLNEQIDSTLQRNRHW